MDDLTDLKTYNDSKRLHIGNSQDDREITATWHNRNTRGRSDASKGTIKYFIRDTDTFSKRGQIVPCW
ncbi:hypothetical protein ST47_g7286 [Ascochyta rabiei]|uniref:Uncharacterized protein n=1 Tax=Didymella rabiei TaxID=5454 RepID=A0A163B3X1_DIDRA|nr:hypothetical protein ST47_g7286 [Ascochyta rabiei]